MQVDKDGNLTEEARDMIHSMARGQTVFIDDISQAPKLMTCVQRYVSIQAENLGLDVGDLDEGSIGYNIIGMKTIKWIMVLIEKIADGKGNFPDYMNLNFLIQRDPALSVAVGIFQLEK